MGRWIRATPVLVHGLVASSACKVGQRAVPQHIRVGLVAYLTPIVCRCGSYVIVRLGRNRYVGLVTYIFEDEEEVDVSLLVPRLSAK